MDLYDLTDWIMVSAVFLGPIVAVRLTRYLDDKKAARDRKIEVYRTLMASRANNLSPAHVGALNSIDLEFDGDNDKEKKVRETWKQYLDLLGDRNMPQEQWGVKRVDLLVDLLSDMGACVGYHFDKVHVKNGVYAPTGHGEIESDQVAIRKGFRALLEGNTAIPIVVTNPSEK